MVLPMLRPDRWGGLATHAGDALFEACYLPEFRESARALRDQYDGSFERFWQDFRSRPAMSRDGDGELLNDWCMAACYSADEDGTVHLPYDPATGRLIAEVWDTVARAGSGAHGGQARGGAAVDARDLHRRRVKRDQFFLDLGAEAFRRELEAIGVTDVAFELFDATHDAIEYRYPMSLRYLAERLATA